ncbi:hypothetical protein NDN08_007508 [Rhodosorus marinus]|uniref:Exonuclease domain-containing protein n=1 Tax=Rhodosorus marinus TaxID=101924 RepID=A0AAV8V0L3_9RHOD|nr:hypothetical protein NDN08_007508 [Rhodosorus marinus]
METDDGGRPDCKIILWDTETTGLTNSARIIEIALMDYDEPSRNLSLLFNPLSEIPNSHIHGITATDVAHSSTFVQSWDKVFRFVQSVAKGSTPVLVAHNSKFDVRMLANEVQRAKGAIRVPNQWRFACSLVDASKIAWPTETSYSMKNLSIKLGIGKTVAHRALDDIFQQRAILQRASEVLGGAVELKTVLFRRAKPLEARTSTQTVTRKIPDEILDADDMSFYFKEDAATYHLSGVCRSLWSQSYSRIEVWNRPPLDKRLCKICSNLLGDQTSEVTGFLSESSTGLPAARRTLEESSVPTLERRDSAVERSRIQSSGSRRLETGMASTETPRTGRVEAKTLSSGKNQLREIPKSLCSTPSVPQQRSTWREGNARSVRRTLTDASNSDFESKSAGENTMKHNGASKEKMSEPKLRRPGKRSQESEAYMYIEGRSVYHSSTCSALQKANASKIKYSPVPPTGLRECKVCNKLNGTAGASEQSTTSTLRTTDRGASTYSESSRASPATGKKGIPTDKICSPSLSDVDLCEPPRAKNDSISQSSEPSSSRLDAKFVKEKTGGQIYMYTDTGRVYHTMHCPGLQQTRKEIRTCFKVPAGLPFCRFCETA